MRFNPLFRDVQDFPVQAGLAISGIGGIMYSLHEF